MHITEEITSRNLSEVVNSLINQVLFIISKMTRKEYLILLGRLTVYFLAAIYLTLQVHFSLYNPQIT